MSELSFDKIIHEYQAQRKYRSNKISQLLREFQTAKPKLLNQNKHQSNQTSSLRINRQPLQANTQQKQQNHHINSHHQNATNQNRIASSEQLHSQNRIHLEELKIQTHPNYHFQHEPKQINEQLNIEPSLSNEQFQILKQNQQLKKQLLGLESEQRDKILSFKVQVENIKNKYVQQIQKMTDKSLKSKDKIYIKMNQLKRDTEVALQKNQQLIAMNSNIKKSVREGNQLMDNYTSEITKTYGQKITNFQTVFKESEERIEAMEKEFNQDEFIQNALKNQDLMKIVMQNAAKAQEAGKILQDYSALLEAKQQILKQIETNNNMKEEEITKMIQIQTKMKDIIQRLNKEKKIYVEENQRMIGQLQDIKELLTGATNQSK